MQRNAARRSLTRTQRALSLALLLAIAALVLLHAVLLWQRLDDRSITRPDVAIRWLAAAAIGFAALLLHRASAGSRVWVVFWLTVAVLHLSGPAGVVLTQAVLAATPLFLLLIAVTIAFACTDAPFVCDAASGAKRSRAIAFLRDRAPPR